VFSLVSVSFNLHFLFQSPASKFLPLFFLLSKCSFHNLQPLFLYYCSSVSQLLRLKCLVFFYVFFSSLQSCLVFAHNWTKVGGAASCRLAAKTG
jgi:hypothetical protein